MEITGSILGVVAIKSSLKSVHESNRLKITWDAYRRVLQECGHPESEAGIAITTLLDENSAPILGLVDVKHYMKQCEITVQDSLINVVLSGFPVLKMPLRSLAVVMLVSYDPCHMVCMGKTSLSSFHLDKESDRLAFFVHLDSEEIANLLLTKIANPTTEISSPYTVNLPAVTSTSSPSTVNLPAVTSTETDNQTTQRKTGNLDYPNPPRIAVIQQAPMTEIEGRPLPARPVFETRRHSQVMSTTFTENTSFKTAQREDPQPSLVSAITGQLSQVQLTSVDRPPNMMTDINETRTTNNLSYPLNPKEYPKRPATTIPLINETNQPNKTVESKISTKGPRPELPPKPGQVPKLPPKPGQVPKLLPKPNSPSPTQRPESQLYENFTQVEPVIRDELFRRIHGNDVIIPPRIKGGNAVVKIDTIRRSEDIYESLVPLPEIDNTKGDSKFMTDLCEEEKVYICYLNSYQTALNDTAMGNDLRRVIGKLYKFHMNTFYPLLKQASNGSTRHLAEALTKTRNHFQVYEELLIIHSKYTECTETFTEIILTTLTRLQKYRQALCTLKSTSSNEAATVQEAMEIIHLTLVRADNYLLIDSIAGSPFTPDQCKFLLHKGTVKLKSKNLSTTKSHLMILNDTHLIFAEKSSTNKKKNKYIGCIKINTLNFEGLEDTTLSITGILHPGSGKLTKIKINALSVEAANRWVTAIKEVLQKIIFIPPAVEQGGSSVLI